MKASVESTQVLTLAGCLFAERLCSEINGCSADTLIPRYIYDSGHEIVKQALFVMVQILYTTCKVFLLKMILMQ